jgi:hypothetical protein
MYSGGSTELYLQLVKEISSLSGAGRVLDLDPKRENRGDPFGEFFCLQITKAAKFGIDCEGRFVLGLLGILTSSNSHSV